MSDNALTRDELELLSSVVWQYRDSRDMSQPEWAEVTAIMDKLDGQLDELE